MSARVKDFLKKEETVVFEEVPEDFDDGWTDADIMAVARKIKKKLGLTEEFYQGEIKQK